MKRSATALFAVAMVCFVLCFMSEVGVAPGDTEVWRALTISLASTSFVMGQIDFDRARDDKKAEEQDDVAWFDSVAFLENEDRQWLEDFGYNTTGMPTTPAPGWEERLGFPRTRPATKAEVVKVIAESDLTKRIAEMRSERCDRAGDSTE